MILEKGDKVLAVHRRLFVEDHGRYFLGVVDAYEDGIAKVTGHTFTVEPYGGTFVRKAEVSTKLLALASGTLLVYQLPPALDIATAAFDVDQQRGVHLTDGVRPVLDLTEGRPGPSLRAQGAVRPRV